MATRTFRINIRLIEGYPRLGFPIFTRGTPSRPEIPGPPGRPFKPPTPIPPQPTVPTPKIPAPPRPSPAPGGAKLPPARPPFGTGTLPKSIFSKGTQAILRRLGLGPLGAITGVFDLLDKISEQLLEITFDEWLQREISRARRGRIEIEREPGTVIITDPAPQTQPDAPNVPKRPKIIEIPAPPALPDFEFPVRIRPRIDPRRPRIEPQTPDISPPPVRTKPGTKAKPKVKPKMPTLPGTVPGVRVLPFFPLPGIFSQPKVNPRVPTRQPTRDPLTPTQPFMPNLPGIGVPATPVPTFPQTATPTGTKVRQKECVEVKRRRRKKGKCREGFFEERPGKTRYITWRTVNCVTRK